jgi:hypothetical protein
MTLEMPGSSQCERLAYAFLPFGAFCKGYPLVWCRKPKNVRNLPAAAHQFVGHVLSLAQAAALSQYLLETKDVD